jgi:hypothetical protein
LKADHLLPIISLFGETLENFYQLGLNDRQGHEMLLEHTKLIMSTPWDSANKLITPVVTNLISQITNSNPEFNELVKSYTDGLKKPQNELIYAFLVPEIFSFMNKWMPGVPYYSFGCSSIFTWCEKRSALVHGRILDFPFVGSFDVNERALLTSHSDGAKTFSLGTSGMPFSSITNISEHGFTLAVHQKFSSIFNKNGKPIFQITQELLNHCKDIDDILAYLETVTSLTSWGLHIGFNDGTVLSVDILGDEFYYDIQQIAEGDVLYFNNFLLEKPENEEDILPFGFHQYCEMREKSFYKKMDQVKFLENEITAESLIKLMSTPLKYNKKDPWICDFTTPSSLQISCLIPETDECLFMPGNAPKLFNGEVIHIESCFDRPKRSLKKIRGKKVEDSYQKGLSHLMQAQVHHDKNDVHLTYHHIQLAIHYFKDHQYYSICLFYFYAFQYIHERNNKNLSEILLGFKNLAKSKKLPTYLNDHCLLFMARLEKMRSGSSSINIEEIKHRALQRVFEFEQKLPQALFHQVTRTFMSVRIDLVDIIYPHVKAQEKELHSI